MSALPKFEGIDVVGATVSIARAGDGLSAALALEPVALHHGDTVYYVLKGEVVQVNHRPLGEDTHLLVRQHRVDTVGITTIEEHVAKPLIEAAEQAIAERQAEAQREIDAKTKGGDLFEDDPTD